MKKKLIIVIVLASLLLVGLFTKELIDLNKDKQLYTKTNNQLKEENQTLKDEIVVLKIKIDSLKQQDDWYVKDDWKIILKQDMYYHIVFNNQLAQLKSGQKIDADISTFEFLSWWFAKDQNKVFFMGFGLDNIDVSSFEIIDDKYVKDKNYVIRIDPPALYIVSNDSSNFKIANDSPKTKNILIDCLWNNMTIPQNRSIENQKWEDGKKISCSYNMHTDLNFYLFSWSEIQKSPVYFDFSIFKEGDAFTDGKIIDDFYGLTLQDKQKINSWELMYFIYEWSENRYYGIKIGDISYRIIVNVWYNLGSNLYYSGSEWLDYITPDSVWNFFEKDIEDAFLSLKTK